MPKYIPTYIASSILCLLLLACHAKTDTATAKTPPSGFHEHPGAAPAAALKYDTSNAKAQDIIQQLDHYYAQQMRLGFNGSVLVGYKGKVIYERYDGLANRETHVPLGPTSACQLASVSKTFTGTAILYLYERKYLDIDAPVQQYLKSFPYAGITVHMLLNHRSGVPDYTKWVPAYRKDQKTPITNAMMLQMMAQYKPALEFRPNSRFKYCNTNYALLAMVVESVTEMKFPDFLQHYIFDPLGMKSTFIYNPNKGLPANAAISYKYNWVREPDMFADGVYGDKNVYSTVEDMYRWDQSFYNHTLLTEPTIELAYGPCSFEKAGIKNYGLGWRMYCYPDGNKIIYHNGWWHGNNTSFYRFIGDGITIIVLGNKYNTAIYHQAPYIFSIVKGIPVMKGFDTEG